MEDPRETLARLGVRPSKGRGQHFLVDARVVPRILAYAAIRPSETVLEIGPGLGVLTSALAERAGHVIAIESDRRFAGHLREILPSVEVLHADALEVDWPPFDVIVSNLPYQISSPVTFKLLDAPFDRAVLMYQWEFAKRMVAAQGTPDYSRLSVGVYVRAACAILERVPRNAFHPQPRVDSALVRLEPRPSPFPMARPDLYAKVVDAAFQHRRKTLENALRLSWASFASDLPEMEALLAGAPFRGRRAEELRPEDFEEVVRAMVRAKA